MIRFILFRISRLVRFNFMSVLTVGILFICLISIQRIIYEISSINNSKTKSSKDEPDGTLSCKSNFSGVSHPLNNLCKYPILNPFDNDILRYIKKVSPITCNGPIPDLVSLNEAGFLIIHQNLAEDNLGFRVICKWRAFAGCLRPEGTKIIFETDWNSFNRIAFPKSHEQIEVRCFKENFETDKISDIVYRNAFARIANRSKEIFAQHNESTLSVDIIVLDSTSLNQFKRHMNKTWDYWINRMNSIYLNGYNKVDDNSMVNLLPILAGLRYGNIQQGMPSDLPVGEVLEFEKIRFLWNDFQSKGCVTMLNDDIAHYKRGFFYYPSSIAKGLWKQPTDHYFRPWHVYHRRYPIHNSTDPNYRYCFGNTPYYKLQLSLTEQFMNGYQDRCHFSFTFLTDITHDDQNYLQHVDEPLITMIEKLYKSNALNRTALIIMGDHGHRISSFMYTYVGRIEERLPFFSIYFPEWFRRKYSVLLSRLNINTNRLTSNYDVYKMLKDIVDENFQTVPLPDTVQAKGISLFREIPVHRTCEQANIPVFHCTCLENAYGRSVRSDLLNNAKKLLSDFARHSKYFTSKSMQCLTTNVEFLEWSLLTTSQMIQYGVRSFDKIYTDQLKTYKNGSIEYIEVKFRLEPSEIISIARLQHNKIKRKLFLNVFPLIIKDDHKCSL